MMRSKGFRFENTDSRNRRAHVQDEVGWINSLSSRLLHDERIVAAIHAHGMISDRHIKLVKEMLLMLYLFLNPTSANKHINSTTSFPHMLLFPSSPGSQPTHIPSRNLSIAMGTFFEGAFVSLSTTYTFSFVSGTPAHFSPSSPSALVPSHSSISHPLSSSAADSAVIHSKPFVSLTSASSPASSTTFLVSSLHAWTATWYPRSSPSSVAVLVVTAGP
jgi:hypothetical protein